MKTVILFVISVLFFVGCGSERSTTDSPVVVKTAGVSEISPAEARRGTDAAYSQFVDVRTPEEFAAGHAYRTINIPLDTLSANLGRLEKNEPVYIICRTDNRSREAAKLLSAAGFKQAIVVKGGTEAWQAGGLPMGK